MHLFLSPHLDDAAFSCGGLIYHLTQQGVPVTILTVTAGDPPDPLPDSHFIRDQHRQWDAGDHPVTTRRCEDACAAAELNANVQYLNFLDCIYRTANGGAPLYTSDDDIFGEVHPQDDTLAALLATPLDVRNIAVLYVPLGMGHHVDHQMTRDWGLALGRRYPTLGLRFYEEFPYARKEGELERALSFYAAQMPGVQWAAHLVPLSEAEIQARVRAMACYTSQMGTVFRREDVEQMTRDYLRCVSAGTPAERYWGFVR